MAEHRLTKLVNNELLLWQQLILADLLCNRAVVIYIEGAAYACREAAGIATLRSLHEQTEYLVDSHSCTCPDSKFRKRTCKHMRALESLHDPSAS